MKAPFPWFGGKSRVASVVWDAFGDVANYVEPFAGSLAVLLARPHEPKIETVNDLDCYLANFWRATKHDPDAVAHYADEPVNEADLTARHNWLLQQKEFRERMFSDPDYYDAKIAGWWVWGLCAWIGGRWCDLKAYEKNPRLYRRLPFLGGSSTGNGIHARSLGDTRDRLRSICSRLRRTRVACGSWERVLGDSVTWRHGVTGILLDPPYSEGNMKYTGGHDVLTDKVREWAIANGDNPRLRIALCGYEGEHVMPSSWRCVAWKANGGYGSMANGQGRENSARERIWFSPHCLQKTEHPSLLGGLSL